MALELDNRGERADVTAIAEVNRNSQNRGDAPLVPVIAGHHNNEVGNIVVNSPNLAPAGRLRSVIQATTYGLANSAVRGSLRTVLFVMYS